MARGWLSVALVAVLVCGVATQPVDRAGSAPVAPSLACGARGTISHGNANLMLLNHLRLQHARDDEILDTQISLWEPATWDKNTTLRVRFLNGNAADATRVMAIASEWSEGITVTFEASTDEDAEIRVTFSGGLASAIGKEASSVSPALPTMELGGWREARDETERRAFVLHEFGHALGALHEHQRRDAPLTWRRPVVYKYYLDKYKWGPRDVDKYVISPFTSTEIVESAAFDRNSVMMYPLLPEFTEERFVQPWNGSLTKFDRQIVAQLYGK